MQGGYGVLHHSGKSASRIIVQRVLLMAGKSGGLLHEVRHDSRQRVCCRIVDTLLLSACCIIVQDVTLMAM